MEGNATVKGGTESNGYTVKKYIYNSFLTLNLHSISRDFLGKVLS